MNKLFLDFYGEKTIIPIPKDFSSLSKEISKIIQLNLSDIFDLDISYTRNNIKKPIKSENDYQLFINSKVHIINLEIVELNELLKNNSSNSGKNIKEDTIKLINLRKKRADIKLKIEKMQEENKNTMDEYKPEIESLKQQKAQYIHKLKKDMKGQTKKEKELLAKITKISKEIKAPYTFKMQKDKPLPFDVNTQKGKEYLELNKRYKDCLNIGNKLYTTPRKNIDVIDKQIKSISLI